MASVTARRSEKASELVLVAAAAARHAPLESCSPAGQLVHTAAEEQVLHDTAHASHLPVVVSAYVELPQKAVQAPVALPLR